MDHFPTIFDQFLTFPERFLTGLDHWLDESDGVDRADELDGSDGFDGSEGSEGSEGSDG